MRCVKTQRRMFTIAAHPLPVEAVHSLFSEAARPLRLRVPFLQRVRLAATCYSLCVFAL